MSCDGGRHRCDPVAGDSAEVALRCRDCGIVFAVAAGTLELVSVDAEPYEADGARIVPIKAKP